MVLSIVIPTISGREHWLAQSLDAIERHTDVEYELIIERGHEVCGTAWNAGIEEARGDYILLSADDLEPWPGWFEAAQSVADAGMLPSALILNPDGTPQSCGDTVHRVPDGTVVSIARIPFATRHQMAHIYPILPIHYACVPTDHRILTQRGFKSYDELVIGEPVLSLDHETGKARWTPLRNISIHHFDGELLTIRTNRGAPNEYFEFTPNHTWPATRKKDGKRVMVEGRDLNSNYGITRIVDFENGESILNPRLARLLGWVATDGCIQRGGEIMWISQTPSKYLREIVDLVGREPQPYVHQTGARVVNLLPEDRKELQRYVRSKEDVVTVVPQLSREAAEAMLDSICKADGSRTSLGQWVIAQSKRWEMREAIQILAILSGSNATIGRPEDGHMVEGESGFGGRAEWWRRPGISLRRSKQLWARKEVMGSTPHEGIVWCPTTDYGTWFVEHEGACLPTGNTDDWFSHRGRLNGWNSVVATGYRWTHHFAMEGRIDERVMEDVEVYWKAAGLTGEPRPAAL